MRELIIKEIMSMHKEMSKKIESSVPGAGPILALYQLPAEQMIETHLNSLTDEILLQTYNIYKQNAFHSRHALTPTFRS